MPDGKVEIDETQLGSLQNTAKIVQKMLGNPKTRRKVLEAYKEAVPDATVPELEATAPFEDRITGLEKTVTDFIKEMKESNEKEKTESQLAKLKAQVAEGHKLLKDRGYTPDGIKLIDEFRDQKGLVEYEDAIRLWELDHPAPQVSDPGDARNMNLLGLMQNEADKNDFYKKLWESQGENNAAVDHAAQSILSELRGAPQRR
jgi:hypothetical protein